MKYKFKRYKINYKGKEYYFLIPFECSQLWLIDWADDWYGGAFIDGNIRCLKYFIASICILAFNPYMIIYFPIRKNKRPNTFAFGDNCEYDMIFKSTKVHIKDKDIKNIVRNLKYVKCTTYKFKIDLKRMKAYFKKNVESIKNIPSYKILKNADGHINKNIAFYTFPQIWYQQEAIDLVDYFFDEFKNNHFSYCYNEKYDSWTPYTMTCFVYHGKRKSKFTYNSPSLTLYVELYDINIINRYKREKVYLVEKNKI